MAKVYSWQVSKSREYAYIVHPDYIDDDELEVYIGNELTGNNLQKVIDWTSNCTNEEYIQQFDKLKQKCINENYNVVFEDVEVYMNVFSTCDNLRGPAGRGISLIKTIDIDPITNISTIAIYYDDNTYDTFEVKNGSDGKDGINGENGTNGYDGVSSKFIMVYGTGIQETEGGNVIPPNRPEGGKYNFITNELEFDENETDLASQGWYRNDNLEGVIYMSSRTFTTSESSTDKEWTTPVRISGDKGETGKDGKSIEFIYNLTQNEPDVTYLESPNESNFVPDVDGWTASPTGVDENNTKEWCSIRTYDSEISKWGAWQKATIWSNYGVNGQDGDGVDYIYLNNNSATPPKNPTPKDYENNQEYQNINSEWIPAENQSYVNINNEVVKFTEAWTDNPNGVNENKQYEWVVSRKYRTNNNKGKSWGAFSNPSLWAKYGSDGKNATSIKKIYTLSSGTDIVPPINETDINGGSMWGTGFPTGYQVGKNVVWGSEAEIWAHSNEFVESYKIISTKDDEGNVIPPEDATKDNTMDVDILPSVKNDFFKYLRYNYDYYIWKGGYCAPFLVTGLKGENGNSVNYTTYVFAFALEDFVPKQPNGTTPDNPGTSMDDMGNIIYWLDFPDTSNGNIDGKVDENGNKWRWYQCCAQVYGYNNTIKKWGEVYPLNGHDGISGIYTEFRFGVTTDNDMPQLVQYDENNNIIREPELYDKGNENKKYGWFLTSTEIPVNITDIINNGGAMWQIWTTIDSTSNKIISGAEWSGPVKISGERGPEGVTGPAGSRGIPGISQNQLYCLGTQTSYFGTFDNTNNMNLPDKMENWYNSDKINSEVIVVEDGFKNIDKYVTGDTYNGRILKANENYYLVIDDKTNVPPVPGTPSGYIAINDIKNDNDIYIWCIQGGDMYNKEELIGVNWCIPFRLQGINGLPGEDGKKAQIIYPMGIYNENETYTTTDKKAPYVLDTQDGLYYVLNKVMTWKGTEQNGVTPSQNYANNPYDPTWEKFESFNALYTSVGIIENGTVGSAVFNGDYMFSQQGIDKSGNINSNYENFNSVEPYNSNNDFRPNICINFKTGEMWASQGNINFSNGDINLSGYIKKNKTIITPENIGYYTITGLTESTETRGVSTPTPTGVTTGVTATPFVGDTYLDVNKIGSYVVFEGVFTKDIYLAIHSIPGSIDYNSSNYDDARSLIGNYIYIINKSNVTVTINTCCREFNTDENIELRDVPIASNNVILFQCFATLQYRRERIYWEYEGGYIQDNILANEQFIYDKCIDGVPSNPCS